MLLQQNPRLSHFLTLWPPQLEQSSPRLQALCYSLFLQKSAQDISLLRIFQLNHTVLHSHQSVQCVCVCVCVCIFCIIMLEHLSIKIKKRITFPISLYIMCVCLFSALSFTNFHYYYRIVTEFCQTRRSRSPSFLLLLSLKRILQFHSDLVFTLAAK